MKKWFILVPSLLVGLVFPPIAGIGFVWFLYILSKELGSSLASQGKRISVDTFGWVGVAPLDRPDAEDEDD